MFQGITDREPIHKGEVLSASGMLTAVPGRPQSAGDRPQPQEALTGPHWAPDPALVLVTPQRKGPARSPFSWSVHSVGGNKIDNTWY